MNSPAPVMAPPESTAESTFPKARNSYTITKETDGFHVKDNDTSTVKILPLTTGLITFSDISLNLQIESQAKTISTQDLNTLIELYIAFFNRVPDANGLGYWIEQRSKGMSFDAISESFYAAAIQYSDQTGYTSAMTNADFVRLIYKNVLGRTGTTAPPDTDVNYWANNISTGTSTKGTLVLTMLNAAHSYSDDPVWNWVPTLLDNKKDVGKEFAVNLGVNYLSPQESITKTQEIVKLIAPDNTAAALKTLNYTNISGTPTSYANAYYGTVKLSNYGKSTRTDGNFVFTRCDFYMTIKIEGNTLIKFTSWRGEWSTGYTEGGTPNYTIDPTKYDEFIWVNNIDISSRGLTAPTPFTVKYYITYTVEKTGVTKTIPTLLSCQP